MEELARSRPRPGVAASRRRRPRPKHQQPYGQFPLQDRDRETCRTVHQTKHRSYLPGGDMACHRGRRPPAPLHGRCRPAAVVIMSPTGGARRWCRAQSGRSGRPWRQQTHDNVSNTSRSWPTIPPHGRTGSKGPTARCPSDTDRPAMPRFATVRPGPLPTFQNGPGPPVPSPRPSGVTRCTSEGAPRHDQVDRGFFRRCWGMCIVTR